MVLFTRIADAEQISYERSSQAHNLTDPPNNAYCGRA